MTRRILLTGLTLLTSALLTFAAEPKDDIQAAVKKLTDAPNYSWSTTVEGGFGRGPVTGKADKDTAAFTATLQETPYDIIVKGDKAVVKNEGAWQNTADLQKAADAGGGGGFSPEMFLILTMQNFQSPAAQIKDLTDKPQNIKKTADGFTADLTAEAAKQIITFRRMPNADPNLPQVTVKEAKGTLQVWIKDGALTKFQIHLIGAISFGDQDIDVDRTTTTELKDVGTTKLTIPDEAAKKLAATATTTAPATTRKSP